MSASSVFAASAERHRGNVHLIVRTDQGRATLCFTAALAKIVGRELGLRAIAPAGEHQEHAKPIDHRAPITKPGGQIL